ncbi:hypothetical protein [uncultured Duncaniella sp.]|jgi:hypothetical protein|uniref:hypothetical protein n=1 Tax=uncultured Duncaniella sp. TaxID=2768039 RepID=UPI002659C542|nr:hypothetical protein [uncultured Duncaniella sp.]
MKTKKLKVEVVETLRKVVTVEIPEELTGDDEREAAIAAAMRKYRNEEVVLSGDDYDSTRFNVVNE